MSGHPTIGKDGAGLRGIRCLPPSLLPSLLIPTLDE